MHVELTSAFIQRLKQREPAAWSDFCREYDPWIRSIPGWAKWRFSSTVQDEIAQEILAAVVTALDHLRSDSAVKALIKQVAIHKCASQVRREIKDRTLFVRLESTPGEASRPVEMVDKSDQFDPIRVLEQQERSRELHTLLGQISPLCRKAIELRYLQGHKYGEISKILGVDVPTVGARLHKCLVKMKDMLKKSKFFREYFPLSDDHVGAEQEKE